MDWLLLAVMAVVGLTAAALVLILLPAPTVDTPVGEAGKDSAAGPEADGEGSDEGGSDEQRNELDAGHRVRPGDNR